MQLINPFLRRPLQIDGLAILAETGDVLMTNLGEQILYDDEDTTFAIENEVPELISNELGEVLADS